MSQEREVTWDGTQCPASPPPSQLLVILLILRERHLGVKSSGIQFVFWLVLLVYEVIRLRSMSLIHQDDLVLVGRGGAGGRVGQGRGLGRGMGRGRGRGVVGVDIAVAHLV